MLSSRHKYLLEQIKNRRLLLIVWDVLNNNMTAATIEVAKDLQSTYFLHEIDAPDLVKAVAAWNPEFTSTFRNAELKIRQEMGVNQPELEALINDMISEIIKYRVKAYYRRQRGDIPRSFKFQFEQ